MEEEIIKTPERKKSGRPKTKYGKKVTFYLSYDAIQKLKQMTTLTRNNSKFVEDIIIKEYSNNPL